MMPREPTPLGRPDGPEDENEREFVFAAIIAYALIFIIALILHGRLV